MLDIVGFMENNNEDMNKLLGGRIRTLRTERGYTQQELGERADINYKFLGEVERGQQNPSFQILVKIAAGLDIELPELFRFEQEITDRKELIKRINSIIKSLNDNNLQQALASLKILFPIR